MQERLKEDFDYGQRKLDKKTPDTTKEESKVAKKDESQNDDSLESPSKVKPGNLEEGKADPSDGFFDSISN